jgi:hypothetical protein
VIRFEAIERLAQSMSVSQACAVLGFPRSSLYRRRQPVSVHEKPPRPTPRRALTADERTVVRELLESERFVDSRPREVYATLLDEGFYDGSIRTL